MSETEKQQEQLEADLLSYATWHKLTMIFDDEPRVIADLEWAVDPELVGPFIKNGITYYALPPGGGPEGEGFDDHSKWTALPEYEYRIFLYSRLLAVLEQRQRRIVMSKVEPYEKYILATKEMIQKKAKTKINDAGKRKRLTAKRDFFLEKIKKYEGSNHPLDQALYAENKTKLDATQKDIDKMDLASTSIDADGFNADESQVEVGDWYETFADFQLATQDEAGNWSGGDKKQGVNLKDTLLNAESELGSIKTNELAPIEGIIGPTRRAKAYWKAFKANIRAQKKDKEKK